MHRRSNAAWVSPQAASPPGPKQLQEITLRAKFHRERKQWIGWCPDLDVSTQGDTRREAEENLHEAVSLFLETCQETGTLEDVLGEARLFLKRLAPQPPTA